MAMSRIVSQALARPSSPAALISHHRHRSSKTKNSGLIEVVELDQVSPSSDSPVAESSSSSAEVMTFGMRKLEEAIHRIIVRRAAPDWLPFLPGYSYWVPPPRARGHHPAADGMIDLIGRLTATRQEEEEEDGGGDDDEDVVFRSSKGWPSSSFYIRGTSPVHPIPVVEVEVEVKVQDNEGHADDTSNTKDEA